MALVLPMQAGCANYFGERLESTCVFGSAPPRRVSDEIQGRLNFVIISGRDTSLGCASIALRGHFLTMKGAVVALALGT